MLGQAGHVADADALFCCLPVGGADIEIKFRPVQLLRPFIFFMVNVPVTRLKSQPLLHQQVRGDAADGTMAETVVVQLWVTITPISSMCAENISSGAGPSRRAKRLPKLSVKVRSTLPLTFSSINSLTAASSPEGPYVSTNSLIKVSILIYRHLVIYFLSRRFEPSPHQGDGMLQVAFFKHAAGRVDVAAGHRHHTGLDSFPAESDRPGIGAPAGKTAELEGDLCLLAGLDQA